VSIHEEQGACGDSGSSLDDIHATAISESRNERIEAGELGPIACECGWPDADRKCSCGWWNCNDCAADGCHNTRCDRNADRYDDDYYRWEER
jgi:hypothetical protein